MTPVNNTRRTGLILGGVALLMALLSFAAVPFYDWFCRTTGFAGTPLIGTAPDEVADSSVTVRFDGSLEAGMPWEFRPMQREMQLKLGETALAFYEAYNPTDHVIAGQASYNVSPDLAGGFFTKMECFCFTLQVLQPGERVEMPVSFYVDPDMLKDRDAKFIRHITLSYTFHLADIPAEEASLSPISVVPVN